MKILAILSLSLCLLAGCSIIPKNVEFFQNKVQAVPEKTDAALERERQAAAYLNDKIAQAYLEGEKNWVTNTVLQPLKDASVVAPALSTSLGPPKREWAWSSTNLATTINKDTAVLNENINEYRTDNRPLEGKKIEGSGLVQMSYFTYIAILIVIFYIIKIGLTIWSSLNPAVGLGLNVAKVPVTVLKRGFSEVIEAGETFKKSVDSRIQDPAVKQQVIELFREAQLSKQSRDVQTAIKTLTDKR